jgi:hypothetical protein
VRKWFDSIPVLQFARAAQWQCSRFVSGRAEVETLARSCDNIVRSMERQQRSGKAGLRGSRGSEIKVFDVTRLNKGLLVAVAGALCMCSARWSSAAPPPPGSEAAKVLAEEGPLIRAMKRPGMSSSCCDESDCRPAEARMNARGKYEVFVRRRDEDGFGWDGGPNQWLEVPDFVVIPPRERKVQQTMACWTKSLYELDLGGTKQTMVDPHHGFLCFNPGQGM